MFSSFLPAFHLIPTSLLREVVESEQKKNVGYEKNCLGKGMLESLVTKYTFTFYIPTIFLKFSMHIGTSQESIFLGSDKTKP